MLRQGMEAFMRCLSLFQPWASLMAIPNGKKNETRGWSTSYRGDIAIHAGKVCDREFALDDRVVRALKDAVDTIQDENLQDIQRIILPAGAVLCVVELYAVHPTTDLPADYILGDDERHFGDYSPDRFVWLTRNLRPLKEPVRTRGYQKIWTLDPEVERLVRGQI